MIPAFNAELMEADIKNDFSCTSVLYCVDLMTAFLQFFSPDLFGLIELPTGCLSHGIWMDAWWMTHVESERCLW